MRLINELSLIFDRLFWLSLFHSPVWYVMYINSEKNITVAATSAIRTKDNIEGHLYKLCTRFIVLLREG